MEAKREPDPRWASFIEYTDQEQKVIGFTLPDSTHLYKYNSTGGWHDQHGNYYNAEGILQDVEKEEDFGEEDQDDESDRDDQLVDQFEQLLKEEETGIYIKSKKEAEPKAVVEQPKTQPTKQQEEGEFNFHAQIQKYLKKEHLKDDLSEDLFIYFKQRSNYFEQIKPQVEKRQSVESKNEAIKSIKEGIEVKRLKIIQNNKWLGGKGVFLDVSGFSEATSQYDRYWYGHIKTTANQYLGLIEQINKSEEFVLLQIKTFYALKSKFYLRKSEQKVKNTIKEFRDKVSAIAQNQTIEIRLDYLPQFFPLSFVYDLVDFAGGNIEDIEEIFANDDISATLFCLKATALKLVNIEGYNHDKGEFIELDVKGARQRVTSAEKSRFYYIGIDSQYKIHERELNDTLALELSKDDVAKFSSAVEEQKTKIRFAVGSASALRRVLMFRGDSLNVILVKPKV